MAMFDLSPVAWSAGQSTHYSTMYATKAVCISKKENESNHSLFEMKPSINVLKMKIMIMQGKHLPTVSFLSYSPDFDWIKFLSKVHTRRFGSKQLLFGLFFMFLC